MTQTIVLVENLNLSYKNIHAVQNVSFSVKPGEVLAIIGHNGSGKTSTVECIEGLRKPDAGFYERPADWKLLLSQLNLADKCKRPVSKLSGGEKQRLSILLALIGRPKLIILDELTTGLDPEVRQNMCASFQTIKESGVAIILVSHYLEEVEALADTILYLEKGRQLFFGSKQNFRNYAREQIPENEWQENCSLEKLYLQIAPKTEGLTMEGIL